MGGGGHYNNDVTSVISENPPAECIVFDISLYGAPQHVTSYIKFCPGSTSGWLPHVLWTVKVIWVGCKCVAEHRNIKIMDGKEM